MSEPSLPRRRGPVRRAGLCISGAATLLGMALVSSWLGSASAQQPTAGQVPLGPAAGPGQPATDAQAKEKAEEPPTPAEVLIDDGKAKIAKLQSAAADIEETIDMLNQHITLSGQYFKAPQYRIYFRLTLGKLADSGGTTLQVCDGETLWDFQAILESQQYHKFSVKPVMERLNSPELDARIKELDAEIKYALGDAEEGIIDGWRVTWKERHRSGYTVEPTSFRQLSIKHLGRDQ